MYAEIKDGEVRFFNEDQLSNTLKSLDGCIVSIQFKKISQTHTDNQRSYYFGAILDVISSNIMQEQDFVASVSDMHEFFKREFLSQTVFVDGKTTTVVGSTRDLTKEEFSGYLEKVIKWAIENLGIQIPTPTKPKPVRGFGLLNTTRNRFNN